MSRRDPAVLLWDLLASIDAIEQFIGTRSAEEYRHDALVRSAVERQFIVIGEVFVRMGPESELALRLGAPVAHVVGMRNALAHGYDQVDDQRVYATARRDLNPLRTAVLRELDALGLDGRLP